MDIHTHAHCTKYPSLLIYIVEYHGIFSSMAGELYKMNLQSLKKMGVLYANTALKCGKYKL